MNRRALFMTLEFPPLHVVRSLPDLGWSPTVLTLPDAAAGRQAATPASIVPPELPVYRNYASGPLYRAVDAITQAWTRAGLRRLIITDAWLPFVPSGVRAGYRLHDVWPLDLIYACGDPNSVYLAAHL